jgi:ankyrin repeat protein
MDYLKSSIGSIKKTVSHFINPNQHPTEFDKYAFNLLDKAEVDLFIEFMELKNVNINVVDYNTTSLLIKAQAIPTYQNEHTKLLNREELENRAIKAIGYLAKRGVNMNYRNKNGQTALLSAAHWGYYHVAEALLKCGADPNVVGSEMQAFTNPLYSAAYKGKKQIIELLILYGADPKITEMCNESMAAKLEKKDL